MSKSENKIWREPLSFWILAILGLLMIYFTYLEGITEMVNSWSREEYSHGYMIPFISVFLIWQRKDLLAMREFDGSWMGVGLVFVGLILYAIGNLSSVLDIIAYGSVITVFGLFLSYMGWRAYKLVAIPLLILLFMIPLPGFLYQSISNELQLLSSELGVGIIRLFDISVYLEGNVIDLGAYQLQVVEACSGLRYLFPLMTLGFIMAYLYKVALWKRLLVFFSTIPITVLMNSLRIGLIGVSVEYWGIEMAEGILHDFEGWFVFMACMVVLFIEMALLTRIGSEKRPLTEVFGLTLPVGDDEGSAVALQRRTPMTFYVALALMVTAAAVNFAQPERTDVIPERKTFTEFPMTIDDWSGRGEKMTKDIISALNFDDYILATYNRLDDDSVGLYIGYYDYQRADKVPHSPKACLPGGGWAITELNEVPIETVKISDKQLVVNRAVIEMGEHKQLVYYWFQQRGRIVTSEWYVKLYLLMDAINFSRTDGALVRLTTAVKRGESLEEADRKLTEFAQSISTHLPEYVPDN